MIRAKNLATVLLFASAAVQPPTTSPAPGSGAGADDGALVLYPPGSDLWKNWFQNRPGSEPQNQGSVALDCDMVTAFKAIPM